MNKPARRLSEIKFITTGKVVFDDNSVLTIQDVENVVAHDSFIDVICTDSKIILSIARMKYVELVEKHEWGDE